MLKEEFQEIINQMFFRLLGTNNFEDIFNAIAGPLLALPGIHTVIVRNAAEITPGCDIIHITGLLTPDDLHEASARRVCRWVSQEGQPLFIQDTRVDPRVDFKEVDHRIRSIECWPIRVNDKIACVLFLISDRIIEFTPEEKTILNVVAEASGYWLSYLRLKEEGDHSRRRLVALEEVSRILNSSLELKTVLNMIIDLSVNLFEINFSCIYLLDKETGRFELKVARGADEGILKELVHRFEKQHEINGLSDFPIMAEDSLIGYLSLGDGPAGFPEKDRELISAFANLAGISIRNSLLFAQRQRANRQTVNALSMAIEARDKYLHGHTARVRESAVALGQKFGLKDKELDDLETACILHDIGKLGVSEAILNKYGEYTDSEFAAFQKHAVIGAEIVEAMEDFSHLVPAIRYHHEKYDGTGYPDGLAGEEIPLQARIIAIADSFAALTADRPHCNHRNSFEALKIIRDDAGTHFDPGLVDAFEKVIREKHTLRIDRLDSRIKPTDTATPPAEEKDLTEREMEILGLIAAGLNNKEISDALCLSEKTVKTHVSNILHKLNLTDRTKAAVYAIKSGLITWVEL